MEEKQISLSADLVPRLAAIDVGTNSIRLVVAEALRDGNYRVLTEEKQTTRLGKDLSTTGRLNPAAIERSLEALRRMKQIASGYQVHEFRVIATCAVREAADGAEFCRRAKEEIDLDVEVISAKQEAHLAFFSVARNFSLAGKNVAVADIGGGSTEIILASGTMIEGICSTPLGAVRLTDLYGAGAGYSTEEFEQLVEGIDRELRRHTKKLILAPHLLIGSGGTFTSLAEMIMAQKRQVGLPLRGYEVTHAEVGHLLDRLRKMPIKTRRNVPGLSPDRADIIVAGVAIVDRLMRRFRVNRLQIHDRGVRDGLLLTMIDRSLGPSSDNRHDQESAIERFAAACGCDLVHGRHVARLAGLLYSQLVDAFQLDPADRPLLESAARLQDAGYLINYEKHHKHSYHLILNSRLAGFQPQELELIANIARYHRGSQPKKKHESFRRLEPKDQERVWRLASILRLAGGLDRTNTQQVQAVAVTVEGRNVNMKVVAAELPEVDMWAVRARAAMFEKAFDCTLSVEWHDPAQQGAGRQTAAGQKSEVQVAGDGASENQAPAGQASEKA